MSKLISEIDVDFSWTAIEAQGYLHPAYAESLAEIGSPRLLPHSGGGILERMVPGSHRKDAMGCYPFFVCKNWSALHHDLALLGGDLVSLALVTDPFGNYDLPCLRQCFEDGP